jgi:hypothetical protein
MESQCCEERSKEKMEERARGNDICEAYKWKWVDWLDSKIQ